MSADVPFMLLRQGVHTLVAVAGVPLMALLVVGLLVGVLQATTQINDPAVGFVPRLVVVLLLAWLLGGWMLERLALMLGSSLMGMAGAP